MKWKLWYADGSTFSSEDGSWSDAPARGVQVLVVCEEEVGWFIEDGSSGRIQNYVYPPWTEHPIGVDHFGLVDFLMEIDELAADEQVTSLTVADLERCGVKIGRTISTAEFERIHDAAVDDPDLPPKSARKWGERAR